MEQPKYDKKPSIPAVEVSLRPLDVDIAPATPQKEPNPPAPIDLDGDGDGDDATKVDPNRLQAMQDEGGNGPREVAEPVSPTAPSVRK